MASRELSPTTNAATRVPARAATTHTPGPWAVQDGDVWDVRWPDREGTERLGCSIAILRRSTPIWDDRDTLPAEANARLISAAPDLLEALRAVKERDDFVPILPRNVLALIDAAIAKATGQEVTEPGDSAPMVGEGEEDSSQSQPCGVAPSEQTGPQSQHSDGEAR